MRSVGASQFNMKYFPIILKNILFLNNNKIYVTLVLDEFESNTSV